MSKPQTQIDTQNNDRHIFVKTIETDIGKINIYRLNVELTEEEKEKQINDFYALIARLLLN